MTTEFNDDLIAFSRAIMGGKKTEKTNARISDELKEAVRRRWMDLGFQSESEYLEHLLVEDCFGKDHVRSVMERRLGLVLSVSDVRPTTPSEPSL